MKEISEDRIFSLIEENELSFSETNSIKSIFLDNIIVSHKLFLEKNGLMFEGKNNSFRESFFKKSNLSRSVLRGKSSFLNCTFVDCNFSKLLFEGNISNCNFLNCNFFETEFIGIKIENSLFVDSDFSSFHLSNCQIKYSNFLINRNFNNDCISNNTEDSVIWVEPIKPTA